MTQQLLSADDLAQLRRIYGERSGDVSILLDHIDAIHERALAALQPFVRVHSVGFEERQYADTDAIYGRILTMDPDKNCSLKAGDLRRAVALLNSLSRAGQP